MGLGPRKLVEHYVQDDYATIPGEIMVLQQDQPLELHGFSMEREAVSYTHLGESFGNIVQRE